VLLGRQGDVKVIDALARGDVRGAVERAEEREAAIAKMIARRAVVHESHDLIAQLAMFDDLVGDDPSELS
jgi:hypothetical protein